MRPNSYLYLLTVIGLVIAFFVGAASAVTISVPGTSDPWLAGMPNGSTASFGDISPDHSPVLVTGINISAENTLTFIATGGTSNGPGCPPSCNDPDGGNFTSHYSGSENGIADVRAPINSLMGVFLDNDQPDLTSPPIALNFEQIGINFTTLSPELKQVFFIGDGLIDTGTGDVQTFEIPLGATRLFLGTMDGFAWFDNSGSFTVEVAVWGLEIINDFVSFEPDPSTYLFTPDATGCQTGAVGKFSFDATLTNISEKELSNLNVEIDELTNDNLLLTGEGLKGEGEIFKIATGYENVALNADVQLKGAPFFEGGQIVSKDTIVDGIFLPRGQNWAQGTVWWDSTDGEDRYIEINLDDEYTINSLIVQADDNDAYKLYYWDMTNNNWQLAWDVPNFNDIQGTGMVTRPNPEDDSERYFLSNPITTDALLFRGNMDDSDRRFSVSEIQAFTGAVNDYSDGILSPDENVDVPFTVCLKNTKPFRFFVNVVGVAAD